jgi:hypothetical protein
MTSKPNIYEQGAMYLIDVDGEQLRAMRTTDTLPWVAENGSLYADEVTTVIRRLVVIDPGEEQEVTGPEVDLSNFEGGYVEIDGKGWVPIAEYEKVAAATNEAVDRLTALAKASEFTRSDGTTPFKMSQSPEYAQTRRVVEAAKWVLTGE